MYQINWRHKILYTGTFSYTQDHQWTKNLKGWWVRRISSDTGEQLKVKVRTLRSEHFSDMFHHIPVLLLWLSWKCSIHSNEPSQLGFGPVRWAYAWSIHTILTHLSDVWLVWMVCLPPCFDLLKKSLLLCAISLQEEYHCSVLPYQAAVVFSFVCKKNKNYWSIQFLQQKCKMIP